MTLSYLENSNEGENEEDVEDEKVGIINGAIFNLEHDLGSIFSIVTSIGIEFPSNYIDWNRILIDQIDGNSILKNQIDENSIPIDAIRWEFDAHQ